MRKIKLLTAIFLITLTLTILYFKRINFAENISITFNNITSQGFSEINFYAFSPLNRILYFNKADNIKEFSSLGNKAFINNIFLFLPDSILENNTTIELSVGEKKYEVNKNNFNDFFIKSNKQKGLYILNKSISNTSLFDIFYAVFSWEKSIKNIILFFFIISALVFIFYFLSGNKSFLSLKNFLNENLRKFKAYLKKFFLKSFIFKLYVIISIILFIVFGFIMHYNIYCGFSPYVFILLLYTFIYLITFVLKKLLSQNTLINIRLTITSIFFILIVLEFFLRVFNVNASYLERNTQCYKRVFNKYKQTRFYTREPLKDIYYTTTEFTYQRNVYANGFTQPMLNIEKKPNEFRILALGDSFTEGVGVCSDSTWINLLNKKLSTYYPDKFINTFNAGVVSSDPVFQYVLLTEKFNTYNFDMVIVATNESDMTDIVIRGGFERFKKDGSVVYKAQPSMEWLYGLSYIYRLIIINGFGYNHILLKNDTYEIKKMEALRTIYETEEKFYKYSKNNNIDLIIAFHPSVSEVCFPHFYKLRYIIDILNKKYPDMHIIDLHNHYINKLKMNSHNVSQYYWNIDGHHNGNGYNAFAECVFNYIIENELIK